MEAVWNGDDRGAALRAADGEGLGVLRCDPWHPEGAREPEMAWVVSFPPEGEITSGFHQVAIECPAAPADSGARKALLVRLALAAIEAGPAHSVEPAQVPPPKRSPEEWLEHIRRVVWAWDAAHREFQIAAHDESEGAEDRLYRALVDLLGWTYVADESFAALWASLPEVTRRNASKQTWD